MVTFNAHEQPTEHSAPDARRKIFLPARRHPTRVATSTLTPGPIVELIAARFR